MSLPQGPGLYSTINLTGTRRDDLSDCHRTHKDADWLPAQLDAQEHHETNRRRPEDDRLSANLPEARKLAELLTADLFNGRPRS